MIVLVAVKALLEIVGVEVFADTLLTGIRSNEKMARGSIGVPDKIRGTALSENASRRWEGRRGVLRNRGREMEPL